MKQTACIFCANFPLKPPLMEPARLPRELFPFHFVVSSSTDAAFPLCEEWSHCQPEIFGVLAWLLDASVNESYNTHRLANAQAAQSDTKGPEESLKICNCGTAGL